MRILGVLVLSAIVSAPAMLILGAVMTPLLWKLESVLGIELAGHSGPADWLLLALCVLFTFGVTALYAWRTREKVLPSNPQL